MASNQADVIYSPATVWVSPLGTAHPDENLAYGADWSGWTSVGWTSAALTLELSVDKSPKTVEQVPGSIGKIITSRELTLETTMAELTLTNLSKSWGGDVVTVAQGAGQPGYESLEITDNFCVSLMQWGFEGRFIDADCTTPLPIRFVCVGDAESGGALEFARETQTGIPLRIEASYEQSGGGYRLGTWLKVTSEAL